MDVECDVLVAGDGCGAVAAARSAALLGCQVVLAGGSGWLGGQLTAQAVPPDEHPWVERAGVTASYRQMREAVRDAYRGDPRLREDVRGRPHLNPGGGWVSGLCAEPAVIHGVLEQLLAPYRAAGNLRLLQHRLPARALVGGDLIRAVEFTSSRGDEPAVVHAAQVIDATEEGDLLPLTGCEHVLGAESSADTGEPHARGGPSDPFDQQALTWCAALELRPAGEDHVIERPARYDFWRSYRAPFWPGPQLGWATQDPETGRPLRRPLFAASGEKDLWRFRRIRDGASYQPPVCDVTVINWPQNDYWLAPITGVPEDAREQRLADARELTRCVIYWLQTEAPRPDGGPGYPQLRPVAGVLGTSDGLAAAPYVRESRRIRAEFTVLEQHVGVAARPGGHSAAPFPDSAGIGSYRIDLHPSTGGQGYVDISCYPFQIPLGALLPVRLDNLTAGGKCLGVTHITNGCYRLHPVEWNTGEAAGALAACALRHHVPPRAIRARHRLLAEYQDLLARLGIELSWPEDIRGTPR
jgi:FAD dependent oxidoreductase